MGDRYTLQNGGSIVTLVFSGGLFQVEIRWSPGPLWPCLDEDSSGYGHGIVRGRRWLSSWTTDVVEEVRKRQGYRCIAKHPERTHVRLRDEVSLKRGKCGGQYKRGLILPCQRASFSGDAVECLSWSRKLSISEHDQHPDGCPLHVTISLLVKEVSLLEKKNLFNEKRFLDKE
jgi:hypothetical protein